MALDSGAARTPEASDALLAWQVHLAARHPARTSLVLTAIVLAAAWALILFGHWVAMVVTGFLLVGATSEFLLPIRYRLTADYAEARGPLFWRRIEWADVRRVYIGVEQVKLSPLPYGGPREPFRGVVLRLEDNSEAVLEVVRRSRNLVGPAGNGEEERSG